jgi:hypothetical protein
MKPSYLLVLLVCLAALFGAHAKGERQEHKLCVLLHLQHKYALGQQLQLPSQQQLSSCMVQSVAAGLLHDALADGPIWLLAGWLEHNYPAS